MKPEYQMRAQIVEAPTAKGVSREELQGWSEPNKAAVLVFNKKIAFQTKTYYNQ